MLKSLQLSPNVTFALQSASINTEAMNAILAGSVPQCVDVEQWGKLWSSDIKNEVGSLSEATNADLLKWAAEQMMRSTMRLFGQLKPIVLDVVINNDDWCDLYIMQQANEPESPVVGIWACDRREAFQALDKWIQSQECSKKAKADMTKKWFAPNMRVIRAES